MHDLLTAMAAAPPLKLKHPVPVQNL